VSSETAQLSLTLPPSQQRGFRATLSALETEGKLRLVAQPSLLVAAGATGTLFVGQSRFVQVLTNNFGIVSAQALKLPIGTELAVTPQLGEGGELTLQLHPRFTTVEEVEAQTGLPTIGVSTFDSTLRLKPGETALVGSLELESKSARQRPGAPLRDTQKTSLLLLITATLETHKTP
jgi:type II secretory pathway component GspD/PulD (secretin)